MKPTSSQLKCRGTKSGTRAVFAAIVLAFLPPAALIGEAGPIIPLPDPRLAAFGAASGDLAAEDLVDSAFLASGVPEADLPARRLALEALLAPIRRDASPENGAAARAEAILELLHAKGPFRSYQATATSLVDVMDRGRFNCVSSAVIYMIATRELGIPCSGIRTSDHAFCVVGLGDRRVDVETTNKYGFDPGSKREFTDSFGRVTGYSYVPPGSYAKREAIDDRRLVSLIISNRVALLEDSRRWSEALALAVSFDALEPGPEGRDFVIGRVNNVAADLLDRGNYAEASRLVDEARSRWGEDSRLDKIAGSAAEASLTASIGNLLFPDAIGQVDASLARGDISKSRAIEFYVYIYGTEANRIGRSGDWLKAAALADEGSAKLGGNATLGQAARNFRHNYVATIHNRYAALYNARRYSEAMDAVREGLAALPGDPTLVADLAAAEKALANPKH